MEENSLLVHRIGGQVFQVLADDEALYVVHLGDVRRRVALYRALADPSEFRPGPGMERIDKPEVESLSALLGVAQTEICVMLRSGEEFVWHVNCCVPEEGLRRIFDGLDLKIGLLPKERALVEVDPEDLPEGLYDSARIREELLKIRNEGGDAPERLPRPAKEVLIDGGMTAASVLFPALWWLHHSRLLFICNLLMLPMGLIVMAREEGGGRLSLKRILWLLPGVALLLINLRVNLTRPMQILLPAAVIAAALTVFYLILCGRRRRLRRAALILALCLITYAPGAALSLNSLHSTVQRTVMADPVLIRPQWVDVYMDGEIRRFYVRPEVTRTLSTASRCEMRRCMGMLGIEYWVLMPTDATGAI